MKTPNYKEKQSKHPIPHAKGIADNKSIPKETTTYDENNEEEE